MAEDINSLWGSAEPYENCGRLEKYALQCQAENSYRGKAFFKSSPALPSHQVPGQGNTQSEWDLGLVISKRFRAGGPEGRNLHSRVEWFKERLFILFHFS